MKLNKLMDKAKEAFDKRGGVDSLKGDADELKSIATGKGSLTDKAKAAADAIKEPGAPKADGAAEAPAKAEGAAPAKAEAEAPAKEPGQSDPS